LDVLHPFLGPVLVLPTRDPCAHNFDQLFNSLRSLKSLEQSFFGEEFNGDILLLWITPRRNTLDSSVIEEILGVVL
jgi:hypothetical protein